MEWLSVAEMSHIVSLPKGYRFERLRRDEIPQLIASIREWYPDIEVGSAACYLRPEFYPEKVFLEGEAPRDTCILLIKHGGEMAALWSVERDSDALTLYGRLLIVAPAHRGSKIAAYVMAGTEAMGRAMSVEFMYAFATLKMPHMQAAFEHAGYQLLGFAAGFDREVVAPGVVKRVFEAVYGKALVDDEQISWPDPRNLTPKAKALFDLLFPAAIGK